MNAPDPRVKADIERALIAMNGQCPHTEVFREKRQCNTCIADASYTAVLTFVARENSYALHR